MRSNQRILFCLAAVLLPLFLACQREDPEVSFSVTTVDMPYSGGSQTVSLTTNYDWTATTSDPWLQVTPASGKKGSASLTLRADANDKGTSRKATVTITCRDLTRGVTVTQMPNFTQSLVIKHTNASFPVPSFTGSSLSGVVKWGDGTEEKYSSSLTHTYAAAGNHTVEIDLSGAYSFKLASVAGVTEIDFQGF